MTAILVILIFIEAILFLNKITYGRFDYFFSFCIQLMSGNIGIIQESPPKK
jgi:hypothetical protein